MNDKGDEKYERDELFGDGMGNFFLFFFAIGG
jgi:hypothetical protein